MYCSNAVRIPVDTDTTFHFIYYIYTETLSSVFRRVRLYGEAQTGEMNVWNCSSIFTAFTF